MSTYEFIKDYKNNDQYRLSFNNLAKETFGIDFETWYQQGHWNENYICYSYLKDESVISNVSLNTMELITYGKRQKAIQIGTVMTDPSYRRQGLAQKLMNKVLEDYDPTYELYFLAADKEAIPLYEKCGFKLNAENQYMIDLTGYNKITEPLKPVEISPKSILEIKKQSQPLSTVLSATGDEHVLMFYYTLGFNHSIYQPQPDVTAIFEIEEDTLHLYEILSPRKVDLQELIEKISPIGVNKVCCHFTPDQPIKNLHASIDTSSNWMLRTTSNNSFPKLARYPKIAQT
ncbi:GNAT family N-acetyltransferase [Neobacillus sp. FSL H8-0543]|uniref:GNAT family N-acetyltransferase n=1 Tax=Neobacillus sp. FSL H8-0543 TaxID=2954672 RepID=UPI003157FF61